MHYVNTKPLKVIDNFVAHIKSAMNVEFSIYWTQKRTRYICGSYCKHSINYNRHTLLTAKTCDLSDNSFKLTVNYAYFLTRLELIVICRYKDDIFHLGSTNNFETLNLLRRDNERFFDNSNSFMEMAVIKTEVWKVYVVVNVFF